MCFIHPFLLLSLPPPQQPLKFISPSGAGVMCHLSLCSLLHPAMVLLIVGAQRILVGITWDVFVGLQNNADQCLLGANWKITLLINYSLTTRVFAFSSLFLYLPLVGRQQNLLAAGLLAPLVPETGTSTKLNTNAL